MKKIYFSLIAALTLSACGGTKEYDAYVATLAAQPEIIDTISTPESYGAYIDSLQAITTAFESAGVKLNDDQREEINALGIKIADAMEARYSAITAAATESADTTAVKSQAND